MSALFDVSSLLTCLLLAVCTCAYLRALTFRANSAVPSLLDHARHGFGELSARRRSRLHLCFFSPKCCRLDIDQILGCDYGAQPFWGESRASLCTSRCSLIVSTRGEVDGERLLPPPTHLLARVHFPLCRLCGLEACARGRAAFSLGLAGLRVHGRLRSSQMRLISSQSGNSSPLAVSDEYRYGAFPFLARHEL